MEVPRVVPMKLYANWEIDRASSSSVQRMFTLGVSRLSIFPFPSQIRSVVITAKLEGYKRSLRSNEIAVTEFHGAVDIPLDISFTIHYPHFLKRRNIVQIHIQRRRKYKNRPIPGGFKTIAMGIVDMSSILQHGGAQREIPLFVADHFKQTTPELQSIGRLTLCACSSLPLDVEIENRHERKEKVGDMSDDSELSEDDEIPLDSDQPEPTSARRERIRDHRMRTMAQRKNIKQKLVNLLKKFKVPEEGGGALSAAASVAREPTAKELQALFDELDDLSDSGNEGIAADEASIVSNPRPALRPYFSREQLLLPAISDERPSDSEGEDLEWSSETEGTGPPMANIQNMGRLALAHSLTAGSIATKNKEVGSARNASVSDQLSSLLNNCDATASSSRTECVWFYSSAEAPHLSSLNSAAVPFINAPTLKDVRAAIQQIVTRIQTFCNSNSSPPPMTWIGVAGGDRLVSNTLRAYVDALQLKSSSSWLNYLRFALLVPPTCLIGRLIAGLDAQLDALGRDVWERWSDMSAAEQRAIGEKMATWPTKGASCINLPIGEVFLQMGGSEQSDSRVFVPFLSEVRVGEGEEEFISSPRPLLHNNNEEPPNTTVLPPQSTVVGGSPPASPQTRTDTHEMHVEYWMGSNQNENILQPTQGTPNYKKESSKGSMKTTFRTLLVTRAMSSPLLALTFVKEKRKDKMLQKLGMKNKQKTEMENSPVQISSISRILCSSSHSKHSSLTVFVDGSPYSDVRYFQVAFQWQTHIKHFPIAVLSPAVIL